MKILRAMACLLGLSARAHQRPRADHNSRCHGQHPVQPGSGRGSVCVPCCRLDAGTGRAIRAGRARCPVQPAHACPGDWYSRGKCDAGTVWHAHARRPVYRGSSHLRANRRHRGIGQSHARAAAARAGHDPELGHDDMPAKEPSGATGENAR